jgi:putative ABC transport system permease protein
MELSDQLRQVLRRLGRAPLFTVVTVITLAAGIGANTLIFSVLEGVLLKPLPYLHAEELVGVWHSAPGINLKNLPASPSTYFVYRDEGKVFQDIGLFTTDLVSVTGVAEPEQERALDVTDGMLGILGVRPVLGRTFTREDDAPGATQTVMLSYGYWRHKFGGDPCVIGRTVVVDGIQRQIIGVLPQRFQSPEENDPALVLPFQFDRTKTNLGNFSYRAVARLKPGGTLAQASADVARMLPIVLKSFPPPPGFSLKLFEDAHIGPNLHPLKQDVVGDIGNALWVLMGSIGLVLLIACANVANLVLVRVEGRRQDLAVRAALGAGRGRLAGDLLLESVFVGLSGSLLGLGLAYGALRVVIAMAPSGLPRVHEIGIDGPVLLFTLAIALLASLLFGCIPIFKFAGAHLNPGLREGGRALSQSREQHRARNVLVVVQVALAIVLLIYSGLMIRTFHALTRVNPGFIAPAEVQSFRIAVPSEQIPDAEAERLVRMEEEILRKIAAIPGVKSVSFSSGIPMDGSNTNDPVFAQDRAYAAGELPPLRRFKFIAPGFFVTLGNPLIAGRDLAWTELYQKVPVAIVSENFAHEYWQSSAGALGKRIRVGSTDEWFEVIGVAANVHDNGVNKEAPATVYWPVLMNRFEGENMFARRDTAFAIRSPRTGSENFLKEIRQTVWSVNPNLPLAEVHSLEHFYNKSLARTSFTLVMLGVAGGMALLLEIVGIYGVIAYSVAQRTREIGIRIALGAQTQALTGMFVRHGLALTGVGIVCGLFTAIGIMRLMSSLLFGVSPVDPVTYCVVSLSVVAIAYLASYFPSRRATKVDPVEALRAE